MKATGEIYHDPTGESWRAGDAIPEWLLEVSPWLLDHGHVSPDGLQAAQQGGDDLDEAHEAAQDDNGAQDAEEAGQADKVEPATVQED